MLNTQDFHSPPDLDAMIAWLETMPAEGTYDYIHPYECCIAQALKAMGVPIFQVGPRTYQTEPDWRVERPLPHGWDRAVGAEPWTYGAALTRFRALRDGRGQ